jgi:peptidoglycan/xylan/chitin deacetylase (PgdA/CDA1 family)
MLAHEAQGVFTLTCHPQVIGRGHRMALLERFIQHALASGAAHFASMGDVARAMSEE